MDMENEGEGGVKRTLRCLPCQSPREETRKKVQCQDRWNYINKFGEIDMFILLLEIADGDV